MAEDRTSVIRPIYVREGEREIVQTRRIGYWGRPREPKQLGGGKVFTYNDPPEGTKDDWVILCDKPGARGPITETRTITLVATEWEVEGDAAV